jgi:hypothetical protein
VLHVFIRDVIEKLNGRFPAPSGETGFEHGRLHSFRQFFVSQAFLGGALEGEIRESVLKSNVLLRAVAPASAHQTAAVEALKRASIRGDDLFLTPQVHVDSMPFPCHGRNRSANGERKSCGACQSAWGRARRRPRYEGIGRLPAGLWVREPIAVVVSDFSKTVYRS